jgi:hypothetical protein
MNFPGSLLVLVSALALVGGAAAPVAAPVPPEAVPAPTPAPAPEPAAAPSPAAAADAPAADDYTTRSLDPALVPEYDPASAPPPTPMADPNDEGGLRQCVGTDGVPIFTDRRCADLGATPKLEPPGGFGGSSTPGSHIARTCARNQDDLLAGVRAALENHDANRLADYYDWVGMGTTEGYRLMERLDTFSARPVVDVQLVRGALPAEAMPIDGAPYFESAVPGEPVAPTGSDESALSRSAPIPTRRRRLAFLLRVDQMRSDQDVASTVTYFHLLTNAGCWWMRF